MSYGVFRHRPLRVKRRRVPFGVSSLSGVSSDLSLSWNILNQIDADLLAQWNILNQVDTDALLQWNILNSADSDLQLSWTILELFRVALISH